MDSGVKHLVVIGAVVAMGVWGCGGDNDVGVAPPDIPVGSARFQLLATSTFGSSPKLLQFDDPSGTVYSLTSAQLAIDKLTFQLPATLDCRSVSSQIHGIVKCDDDEVQIDGPFVVDLRSGQTTPDLGDVTIPAVDYGQVTVDANELRATDEVLPIGAELIDRTVVAHAEFQYENSKRGLDLEFRFHKKLLARVALPVQDGAVITLPFDVAQWLNNIPVTTCLMNGDVSAKDNVVKIDGNDFSGLCSNADDEFQTNLYNSFAGTN